MTKIGYLLPTRENIMRGEHGVQPLLESAKFAQSLGYDSLWIGDSLFTRARHDPLTLLAAVSAQVPEVELGTAVLLPALRNPVVLAQQLATLDQVSEGRLIIGAGIGADTPQIRAEFEAASVPFEKRVGRLMEGFDLCRALWKGEPVTWDGRWKLDNVTLAPKPHRPGGPPIWLASNVEAGVRRAARLYDGWFPIGPTAEAVKANHAVLSAAASDAGRPLPTAAVYLTICVGQHGEDCERQIDTYLQDYYGVPAEFLRQVQACFGGTVADVLAFMRDFVTAGADHLVLRIVGDHHATLRALAEHRGDL